MSRQPRRLFQEEEPSSEAGRFGCPMLVRSRFGEMVQGPIPVMRCSLGWGVHDELDAARCRATESVGDCWKAHPERTPMIALAGGEPGATTDDPDESIPAAGD
ncbi:MAG: hypothetical protein ACKOWF_04330 [Chloroflexota bacterium]